MEEEELPKRASKIGNEVCKKVEGIMDQCPWIGGVRGLGAMQGIIIIDPETGAADKKRTMRIHQHALENGLIMITAGTDGNIIRTLMPLIIKDDELNESLEVLSDALINA